jgi:hypothetical protein
MVTNGFYADHTRQITAFAQQRQGVVTRRRHRHAVFGVRDVDAGVVVDVNAALGEEFARAASRTNDADR